MYHFDIDRLAIEAVETSDDSPGLISRHKAKRIKNAIEVSGGKVGRIGDDKEL